MPPRLTTVNTAHRNRSPALLNALWPGPRFPVPGFPVAVVISVAADAEAAAGAALPFNSSMLVSSVNKPFLWREVWLKKFGIPIAFQIPTGIMLSPTTIMEIQNAETEW
jgi:hypothetical protein